MHARFRSTATLDVQVRDAVLDPPEGRERVGVGEREAPRGVILTHGIANTSAMTRGVNCPLASCTTMSVAERTKTMNVSIDPARVPRTARAPSGLNPNSDPPGLPVEPPDRRGSQQRRDQRQPGPEHQRGAGGVPQSVSLLPGHGIRLRQVEAVTRPEHRARLFQMSRAYSAIVRSLENFPDRATLWIAFAAHAGRSRYSAATFSCVST